MKTVKLITLSCLVTACGGNIVKPTTDAGIEPAADVVPQQTITGEYLVRILQTKNTCNTDEMEDEIVYLYLFPKNIEETFIKFYFVRDPFLIGPGSIIMVWDDMPYKDNKFSLEIVEGFYKAFVEGEYNDPELIIKYSRDTWRDLVTKDEPCRLEWDFITEKTADYPQFE